MSDDGDVKDSRQELCGRLSFASAQTKGGR